MTEFLQFAVLGLGTGAAYSLFATGIVTLYRGTGVLNFAVAAIGMVSAFLYADLTSAGWPVLGAVVFAVFIAAVLGVLCYQLLMRPLAGASSLARVIATLGVLLTIQGAAVLIWGAEPEFVEPILPTELITIGGVNIGDGELILVGIAAGIAAALWAGYRFSTLGLAVTASSENGRAAAALGWSPNLIATAAWAFASALAGIAGVLIAPVTGIQVSTMPMLIIPALAAALVGGLTSLPLTLLGALAIGVIQSLVAFKVNVQGASETIPFLLIILVLVIRGRGMPTRGHIGESFADVGSGRVRPQLVAPAVVVIALLMVFVFGADLLSALSTTFAVSCILLSIVVLTGYAGQLSLGQFAVAGVGALIASKLIAEASFGFLPAVLVGALATIPVGLVFGLPAIRTRGVNLAVVTLGLGLAVQQILFNNPSVLGTAEGVEIGSPKLFGFDIGAVAHPERYAVMTLVAFTLCALLVANLRRGAAGRRLLAVRTNERAAAAMGIGVTGAKLYSFGLAAGLAAIGGVLLGFQNPVVGFSQFGPTGSITGVAFAVVGSVGWIAGSFVGATFYAGSLGIWILQQIFGGGITDYVVLIGGVSLLVFLLLNPNGIVSGNTELWHRLRLKLRGDDRPRELPPELRDPIEDGDRGVSSDQILEVSGLTVRYGGVVAADSVSFQVRPGEVVGLIGPNGAGKTTVIDAISGFAPVAAGEVALGGESLTSRPPHQRVRAGVSRSFQALELFEDVTVLENLEAASDQHDFTSYLLGLVRPGRRRLSANAGLAIEEFELGPDLGKRPSELSFGRRRLVAVARAVASSPSILLLDEPAAGLDDRESAELAEFVQVIAKRWGIGVLLVEHDMAFVNRLCDQLTVLDFGRQIALGPTAEVRRDPAVIAAYLGGSPDGGVDAATAAIDTAGVGGVAEEAGEER